MMPLTPLVPNRYVLIFSVVCGLTSCTTNYAWDVDQRTGQVYLKGTRQVFDPQKAAAVVDSVNDAAISTVGAYARGYAASAEEYQATHPTVYVQPTYVPQQQHGTATVITPGAPISFINY
jgi:hypothetical protein